MAGYQNLTAAKPEGKLCAVLLKKKLKQHKVSTGILTFWCPSETLEITKFIGRMFPEFQFPPFLSPSVKRQEIIFWGCLRWGEWGLGAGRRLLAPSLG